MYRTKESRCTNAGKRRVSGPYHAATGCGPDAGNTHWWHLSWVSWYSRSNNSACCRPQLKRRAELWGPWLSLLPFWKKQVRFHRMGGSVFVGQRPPPSSLAPCFIESFCINNREIQVNKRLQTHIVLLSSIPRVSRGVHTHAPRRGQNKSCTLVGYLA